MKNIFKLLSLLLITTHITSLETQRKLSTTVTKPNLSQKPRKAYFTPYINLFEDYSARPNGAKIAKPSTSTAGDAPFGSTPGNMSAPIPTVMNGLSTANPMMYGMGMMHPPGASMGAMGGMGMGGMGMGGMGGMGPLGGMGGGGAMGQVAGMGANNMASSANISGPNIGFGTNLQNNAFPEIQVRGHCENVKRQAVIVANQIVRKQNRKLFKEIMNYLLKAKFLVGMTEIKLTRVLKKKIFGLIKQHTTVTSDNVQFIDSKYDEMIDESEEGLDSKLKK